MGQKRGLFSLGWDHLFKSSAPSFSIYLSESARSVFQDYARPSTIVISQSSNFYGPPFPNIPRVGSGGKKSHSSQDRLSARKINVWVPNSPSSFTIKKGWRPQTSSRERKSVLFGTLKRWSVGVNEAKINRNAENGLFKCFFTPTCHFYCFFFHSREMTADVRCFIITGKNLQNEKEMGHKAVKAEKIGPQKSVKKTSIMPRDLSSPTLITGTRWDRRRGTSLDSERNLIFVSLFNSAPRCVSQFGGRFCHPAWLSRQTRLKKRRGFKKSPMRPIIFSSPPFGTNLHRFEGTTSADFPRCFHAGKKKFAYSV